MKYYTLLGLASLSTLSFTTLGQQVDMPTKDSPELNKLAREQGQWQLVWSDEFNGKKIDLTKWGFEVNCHGGGNHEQQCYTDDPSNAFLAEGMLNIVAKRETHTGPAENGDTENTATLPYTSARLRTMNKGDWQYGRFEIRAKLPQGQGSWPAIWMLPTDWVYGGWAASGEIDIMEAVNLKTPTDAPNASKNTLESRVHGTLHYGASAPNNVYTGTPYVFSPEQNPADVFHVYALEWEQGEIRWYIDGEHYATQRQAGWYSQYEEKGHLQNAKEDAPFNQRFHMLLNLAVGGTWSANVNQKGIDESVFPQSMLIDFVRVYQCSSQPSTGKGCATLGKNAKLVEGKTAPSID